MNTQKLLDIIGSLRLFRTKRILVISIIASTFGFGQEPPSGPPDIEVLDAPPFTPGAPTPWIIPPFNSALPESTTLGEQQSVVLRAVSTVAELANYQWFKDGEALPGETRDTLGIEIVSPEDAGVYRVDVGQGSSLISSNEIEFIVVPLSEIDELFSEWLSRIFSPEELGNPDISGESADPDFDLISNLFEYALGLNPKVKETPPKLEIVNHLSNSSSLVFMRARNRESISFSVEGSSTLENWTPLSQIATRIESSGQSTDTVEIEVEWDKDPEYPRFLRLIATQSTP